MIERKADIKLVQLDSVHTTDIQAELVSDRFYKLTRKYFSVAHGFIKIEDKEVKRFKLVFKAEKGFITDFRSGSPLLDPVFPPCFPDNGIINRDDDEVKFKTASAWINHDISFYGFPWITFNFANDLLYKSLMALPGWHFRPYLIYAGLSMFGSSHYTSFEDVDSMKDKILVNNTTEYENRELCKISFGVTDDIIQIDDGGKYVI